MLALVKIMWQSMIAAAGERQLIKIMPNLYLPASSYLLYYLTVYFVFHFW